MAARSSGTRLYNIKLAWIGLLLFNVAAMAGTIALSLGHNDGNLEYREWPWPIRLIFLGALVITAWNLIGTVAQRGTDDIYLSNWYTIAGGDPAVVPVRPRSGIRFPDDNPKPIIDEELLTDVTLDTRSLEDGPHRLLIRAQGQSGREGVEEIPFQVHNGPGIIVSGLSANSTRRGEVRFTVDAFSADDPFDPRRAEARSSIPVWVWVMPLLVVAWPVWYAARMWDVPAQFADTPNLRSPGGDTDQIRPQP